MPFRNISSSLILTVCFLLVVSCGRTSDKSAFPSDSYPTLTAAIDSAVSAGKGQIAVAIILDNGDTIKVGSSERQPLMSVFKLHQAIAVCHTLDHIGISLDTMLHISANELNPDTWSPIVKEFGRKDMDMSVRRLMEYLLLYSDNNASNILFDRIVSVRATDSIVRTITPVQDFILLHTEREMQLDHQRSCDNASTAVACASLIRSVFTDSLVSSSKQTALRDMLSRCKSAKQRMAVAVTEIPGAKIAHRTGSGYTNERGEIMCINDVALITYPSGKQIAISVMIRDYPGSQQQADSTIASITRKVLRNYK